MFNKLDHITGAILVRIRRKSYSLLGKADASFLDSNLAIGGVCNTAVLSKNGFNCILDMREEDKHDEELISKLGINYFRIPVTDRKTPTMSDTYQAIDWLKKNLQENRKIFIHCNLGRGRGPMIACLYLISKGIQASEAIKMVKRTRRYTYFNKNQIQFLYAFFNNLQ